MFPQPILLLDRFCLYWEVALADGCRRSLQAVEIALPTWPGLGRLFRQRTLPGIQRAARGLTRRLQQLFFVVDNLCWIIGGQFIFLPYGDSAGQEEAG
jgi:hypothetical protein